MRDYASAPDLSVLLLLWSSIATLAIGVLAFLIIKLVFTVTNVPPITPSM